jgi:hypothetical protein
MKKDFMNITDYAERFDMKKYDKQVKLNKLYEKRKKEAALKNPEKADLTKETEIKVGPTEEVSVMDQEEIEEFTVSIANNNGDYDSKHWEQRIVKSQIKEGAE